MSVIDYKSFIQYIKTKELKCGYLLITLFSAIELRDAEGRFSKEQLIDFFIKFYKIREKYKLVLVKECNPLQAGDRNSIIQLINENPINVLIKDNILETPEQFNPTINQIIFENEHEILLTIKTKFIVLYHETLKDRTLTLSLFPDDMGISFISDLIGECFSEWQLYINDVIKTDASRKLAAAVNKIDIEPLLRYLFQSYSLQNLNQLLAQFQMTEEELRDYFSGEIDYSKLPLLAEIQTPKKISSPKVHESTVPEPPIHEPSAPEPPIHEMPEELMEEPITEIKPILQSPSEKKVQVLTNLFQQMQETDVEEDYYETKQKALEESQRILEGRPEKKKGRFGFFKKLFKKGS